MCSAVLGSAEVGGRGGQLIEQERGEAADTIVYTLMLLLLPSMLLRSAIERDAKWGVGVT